MKKGISTKVLIIICAVLIVASAAAAYFVFAGKSGRTAEVSVDGEVLYTIDLDTVSQPYTIELSGNTLLVETEGVTVIAADCPDKLCMHAGRLESGALPITCLPNRVVIRLTAEDGSIDAVSGR